MTRKALAAVLGLLVLLPFTAPFKTFDMGRTSRTASAWFNLSPEAAPISNAPSSSCLVARTRRPVSAPAVLSFQAFVAFSRDNASSHRSPDTRSTPTSPPAPFSLRC